MLRVRVARDDLRFAAEALRRAVPLLAVRAIPVDFRQRGVIDVRADASSTAARYPHDHGLPLDDVFEPLLFLRTPLQTSAECQQFAHGHLADQRPPSRLRQLELQVNGPCLSGVAYPVQKDGGIEEVRRFRHSLPECRERSLEVRI